MHFTYQIPISLYCTLAPLAPLFFRWRKMSLHSAKSVEGMSPLMFSLQALLVRHESYIADSERERKAMSAHVEMLEAEKQALERKNL